MAISLSLLTTRNLATGGSQTFTVTLGGSGSSNALMIYVPANYGVWTNCTASIGGVAATKLYGKWSGTNACCHAILGRYNLSPGSYSITVTPNEWHGYQVFVYAVYDTIGWNNYYPEWLRPADNTTKTITVYPSKGNLWVEHIRYNSTNNWAVPAQLSGQTQLGRVQDVISGGYWNNSIMYKYDVGTSFSSSYSITRSLLTGSQYVGVEFLPKTGGSSQVIWWFKKWLEEKKKIMFPTLELVYI